MLRSPKNDKPCVWLAFVPNCWAKSENENSDSPESLFVEALDSISCHVGTTVSLVLFLLTSSTNCQALDTIVTFSEVFQQATAKLCSNRKQAAPPVCGPLHFVGTPAALLHLPCLPRSLAKMASPGSYESWEDLGDIKRTLLPPLFSPLVGGDIQAHWHLVGHSSPDMYRGVWFICVCIHTYIYKSQIHSETNSSLFSQGAQNSVFILLLILKGLCRVCIKQ